MGIGIPPSAMEANADDPSALSLPPISPSGSRNQQIYKEAIDFHQQALDDLVSVNSLLSVAVFVGLTFSVSLSLESRSHCKVPDEVAWHLLIYEVVSFAFFMLSSLVAKALKIYLSAYIFSDSFIIRSLWSKLLRGPMLLLSAWSTFLGCIFLMISILYIAELRLGELSCSQDTMKTVGGLTAIIYFALVIYIPFTLYAIYKSARLSD